MVAAIRAMPQRRRLGWIVNIALRAAIVAFAVEAVVAQYDARFAGKGIAVRDLILVGTALTLVIPALHAARGRGKPYPLASDCLLLSVMALDMAGNSFGLYDQAWRFDLVAHGYGPAAAVLALAFTGVGWAVSVLAVNGGHVLLEIQEAVTDALFGTHNVRGTWDSASDLLAGLLTTMGVWWFAAWRRQRRQRRSESSPAESTTTGRRDAHGGHARSLGDALRWQAERPGGG